MQDSYGLGASLLRGEAYFGPALAAMQGPPERHKYFLPTAALLCERFDGAIRILEIGSWAGASSISWVKAFISLGRAVTLDCVDRWEPYFDLSLEANEHYRRMNDAAASQHIYPLFLHNIRAEGVENYVHILRGASGEILPKLKDKTYHLIYIDGSHLYPDVKHDISHAKRLILNRGFICGDDLEIQAAEVTTEELARAVESRADYTSVDGGSRFFHPGVTAAVAEELGSVSTWQGYWGIAFERERVRKISLDLSKASLPAHVQRAIARVPILRIIEEDDNFRIVEISNRYMAVASHIDLQKACIELSPDFDVPPAIYVADSLAVLKEKLKAAQGAGKASSDGRQDDTPMLIGTFEDFNLVSFRGQVIGVHLSSGPIDVRDGIPALLERLGPEKVIVGTSEDSVIVGIAMLRRLSDAEARHAERIDMLGESLANAEAALNLSMKQAEAREAKSVEALGQRIEAMEAALKRDATVVAHHAERIDMLGESLANAEAALNLSMKQAEAGQAKCVEALGQQIDQIARILDGITQSTAGRLLFPKNRKGDG